MRKVLGKGPRADRVGVKGDKREAGALMKKGERGVKFTLVSASSRWRSASERGGQTAAEDIFGGGI